MACQRSKLNPNENTYCQAEWKGQQITMAPIANRALSPMPIGLGVFSNNAKSFDLATFLGKATTEKKR